MGKATRIFVLYSFYRCVVLLLIDIFWVLLQVYCSILAEKANVKNRDKQGTLKEKGQPETAWWFKKNRAFLCRRRSLSWLVTKTGNVCRWTRKFVGLLLCCRFDELTFDSLQSDFSNFLLFCVSYRLTCEWCFLKNADAGMHVSRYLTEYITI